MRDTSEKLRARVENVFGERELERMRCRLPAGSSSKIIKKTKLDIICSSTSLRMVALLTTQYDYDTACVRDLHVHMEVVDESLPANAAKKKNTTYALQFCTIVFPTNAVKKNDVRNAVVAL